MTRPHNGATRILVVDADPALLGLLEEWLEGQGWRVAAEGAGDDWGRNDFDLAVVDVPFPRQGGLCQLKRVAERHPGVPILALSSNFFAGIANNGRVARALGVAGALPKPLSREALLAAVGELLDAAR
jgi:CheY-like chemotaxis protein